MRFPLKFKVRPKGTVRELSMSEGFVIFDNLPE